MCRGFKAPSDTGGVVSYGLVGGVEVLIFVEGGGVVGRGVMYIVRGREARDRGM